MSKRCWFKLYWLQNVFWQIWWRFAFEKTLWKWHQKQVPQIIWIVPDKLTGDKCIVTNYRPILCYQKFVEKTINNSPINNLFAKSIPGHWKSKWFWLNIYWLQYGFRQIWLWSSFEKTLWNWHQKQAPHSNRIIPDKSCTNLFKNGVYSSPIKTTNGVTQKSISWPILLFVFVKVFPKRYAQLFSLLFADNANFSRLNRYSDDFNALYDWTVRNNMPINMDKCSLIEICENE